MQLTGAFLQDCGLATLTLIVGFIALYYAYKRDQKEMDSMTEEERNEDWWTRQW
jgi:hypothetical protein